MKEMSATLVNIIRQDKMETQLIATKQEMNTSQKELKEG